MQAIAYEYFRQAIRMISNFLFKIRAKKNRQQGKRLFRISITRSGTLSSLKLYTYQDGSESSTPLKYSLTHKEYFLELWLIDNTEFLIKSPTQTYILNTFPVRISNAHGRVNYTKFINWRLEKNLFRINQKRNAIDLIFKGFCISSGKVPSRNEDAFFMSDKTLGIADGVGGVFTDCGVSSKCFSAELMKICKKITGSGKAFGKDAVKLALGQMANGGSSTYLLASIVENKLKVSVLGDSCMVLFREIAGKVKVVLKSSPKTYDGITPYQVSKAFSSTQLQICKKKITDQFFIDSDEYSVCIQEDDLLLIGTDGLFDNVYERDLLKIVRKSYREGVGSIVQQIFQLAKENSRGCGKTPFADRVSSPKCRWIGGKTDDITVMISKICRSLENDVPKYLSDVVI